MNSAASHTSSRKKTRKQAAEQTVFCPGGLFFTHAVPWPQGVKDKELDALAGLSLEDVSPFSLETLAWGYRADPHSNSLFIFAACLPRVGAAEDWPRAEHVFPAFLPLIASRSAEAPAPPAWELLWNGNEVLLLERANGGQWPSRIHTQALAAQPSTAAAPVAPSVAPAATAASAVSDKNAATATDASGADASATGVSTAGVKAAGTSSFATAVASASKGGQSATTGDDISAQAASAQVASSQAASSQTSQTVLALEAAQALLLRAGAVENADAAIAFLQRSPLLRLVRTRQERRGGVHFQLEAVPPAAFAGAQAGNAPVAGSSAGAIAAAGNFGDDFAGRSFETALHTEQDGWTADLRSRAFLEALRKRRQADKRLWLVLCAALWGALVLAVLWGASWLMDLRLDSRITRLNARSALVDRVKSDQDLLNRMRQFSAEPFAPFSLIAALTASKPPAIYFDTILMDAPDMVDIEGQAPTVDAVNAYVQALEQGGRFRVRNQARISIRDGVSVFTLYLQYVGAGSASGSVAGAASAAGAGAGAVVQPAAAASAPATAAPKAAPSLEEIIAAGTARPLPVIASAANTAAAANAAANAASSPYEPGWQNAVPSAAFAPNQPAAPEQGESAAEPAAGTAAEPTLQNTEETTND